ncbi:hypothetical protein [Parasitella parasitica]|uniref:Uncharacterized protein n=1 Tax=Parasitella parasitica TaxID=35722 RepID=A0A0B7N786_9FUNG|nr:hypothetical protein [Parasitella parasitica]
MLPPIPVSRSEKAIRQRNITQAQKESSKRDKGKASTSSLIPAAQQEAVTAPKKNKGKEKASILHPAAHNFQQDLDAPGPSTAPSYSTSVSTLVEDFDAIFLAMSPKEVEDFFNTFQDPVPSLNLAKTASPSGPSISETASISNTSAPAPKASGETDTEDKRVFKKVQKKIDKREELEKVKDEAKDSSKSMKCPTCGGTDHA